LKILAASILSEREITVNHVPNIEEVNRLLELMETIGTTVTRNGEQVILKTEKIKTGELDAELVKKIRAAVLLVGPLLARHGEVKMPHPGGCAIGQRPIDLFIEGFKKFGVEVKEEFDHYHFKTKKLKGMTYIFPKISVTVTEALMMTATLAEGATVLKNAACEPEIPALAEYLNRVGAKITGAGTHTIIIEGVKKLGAETFEVIPDRIEAGSFAILGALLAEDLKIINCVPEHLESLFVMFDKVGVDYQIGRDWIQVFGAKKLKAADIQTHEYPGFVTDLQSPFSVLLTQAVGMSMVHETIFEGRLFYTDMLNQMGAKIIMCDPHRVLIQGPTPLYGRRLTSPDLRTGFAMIIAALAASGETEIDNIYQIDRGYENIEKRLQAVGADIRRIVD
jgi:UDP-N-acetylglucosamine 1-carboxyvinyltransferase